VVKRVLDIWVTLSITVIPIEIYWLLVNVFAEMVRLNQLEV
jgi:hypothetical protein